MTITFTYRLNLYVFKDLSIVKTLFSKDLYKDLYKDLQRHFKDLSKTIHRGLY